MDAVFLSGEDVVRAMTLLPKGSNYAVVNPATMTPDRDMGRFTVLSKFAMFDEPMNQQVQLTAELLSAIVAMDAAAAEVVALLRCAAEIGGWKGGVTGLLMLTPTQVMAKVYRLAETSPAFDHHVRNGGWGNAGNPTQITKVMAMLQSEMTPWARAAAEHVWEHDAPRNTQGEVSALLIPIIWRANATIERYRVTDMGPVLENFARSWTRPPLEVTAPGNTAEAPPTKQWRLGTTQAKDAWRAWFAMKEAGSDPYEGAAHHFHTTLQAAKHRARANDAANFSRLDMRTMLDTGNSVHETVNDAYNRAMAAAERAERAAADRALPSPSPASRIWGDVGFESMRKWLGSDK